MQLTVESVGPSKSGKALRIKAGGKWYGAKKDSGITAGATIDAEVEDGDFGLWINKWKAVNGSQANARAGDEPAVNRIAGAGGSPAWLPFASNTVAHAIAAQIITAPNQIEPWVRAAKDAFTKVAGE